jgi:hypothetical protein
MGRPALISILVGAVKTTAAPKEQEEGGERARALADATRVIGYAMHAIKNAMSRRSIARARKNTRCASAATLDTLMSTPDTTPDLAAEHRDRFAVNEVGVARSFPNVRRKNSMRLSSLGIALLAALSAPAAALAQGGATSGGAGATPPAPNAPATTAPAASAPTTTTTTTMTPTPVSPPPAAPAVTPAPASPPATLTPTTTAAPAAPPKAPSSVDLSLPPSLPAVTGTTLTTKQAESLTPTTSSGAGSDEWKFTFHGYFRAPLHASWGPPSPTNPPSSTGGPGSVNPYPPGADPPPGTQLHALPRVPGYQYTSWEFTNTLGGPWTQLNFSYGNSRVTGTVIIDSWNQTDGSYKNLQAQQGIDQVFLTLNYPDALGDYGGLIWNIGSFANRYGAAGKYDGGMYETYLFGRTHVTGETLTANLTNLDAPGDWAVTLEHGVGMKLNAVPFLDNPWYKVIGNGMSSGSNYQSDQDLEYLPYSGPVPEGSTFLHHAHVFAKYRKTWTLGAHYLFTWTPDDNWSPINSTRTDPTNPNGDPRLTQRTAGPIQGSMAILGGEARFEGREYGYGYLGYSHIDARNINALAQSVEVLHSYSGYSFKENFFGRTYNKHNGLYQGPENETGTVDSIMAQYSFSLGAWNKAPEEFWGDGTDLVFTAFGLLSIVHSPASPYAVVNNPDPSRNLAQLWDMTTKKLKFGLDAQYTPLSWLGFGARYDNVKPDLDSAYSRTTQTVQVNGQSLLLQNAGGSDLNFQVLTARAVLKTEFVTHETVTLLYSHYFLGPAAYPSYPLNWVARADADAVQLAATLWW